MFSFAKKLVDRFEGSNEPSVDSYFKSTTQINNRGYGLRVLAVKPHSIAQQHGLESWFDYIVRINNHELPMQYPSLLNYNYSINDDGTINYGGNTTQEQASLVNFDLISKEIHNICSNEKGTKELILDVWSAKGGVIRQLVIPLSEESNSSEKNDSQSLVPDGFAQIGATVQSQQLITATYVWRILNTHQDSPAFQAQLVPYSDYIIGCDSAFPDDPNGKGLLSKGGEALLSRTVLQYYNANFERTQDHFVPITLYVYNHDYDVLRPVTVNLTRNWGSGHNKGILGCDVGYGLLHRIPEVVGKFDKEKLVDDVIFEAQQNVEYQVNEPSENLFTPINTVPPPVGAIPPPTGAATANTKAKKKRQSRPDALSGLNDYMNEELEKSKDTEAKPTNSGAVPPPPKASL